jgi:hypothetical protein
MKIEDGHYVAKDRNGVVKKFPLLSVSAAIIRVPEGKRDTSSDELSNILAKLKKEAKQSPTKVAYLDMGKDGIVETEPNRPYLKAYQA